MADIPQTWARDPEIAGSGGPGHQLTPGSSEEYADTDRFGKTITANRTKPIMSPQNKWNDPVWGVNAPAGGQSTSTPEAPEIPVASGE
jgi:hypothetical protein